MTLASPATAQEFTPGAVEAAYASVRASLPAASAPLEDWLTAFESWNGLKRIIDGAACRIRFREAQDTLDPTVRETARVMREAIEPVLQPHEAALRTAFLAAECRPALAEQLGVQLFVNYELEQAAYAPANIPLRVDEGQATTAYTRLLGAASFDGGDGPISLMVAQSRLTDPDPVLRRGAASGLQGWMEAHSDEFHGLYDRVLDVRHRMALNLGDENYLPLGYRRLGRSDYGPPEVAVFREEIRHHVVPVMARFRAWQAQAQGVEIVAGADAEYYPGLSLPAGVAPIAQQLTRAQTMFDRLDPRMAAHFRKMTEGGLIDLETRPGKATGAFCTVYEDTAEAAIFCNSTGNAIDVITLIHEMGHAIQVWESLPIPAMDLRWPGMDAAEVLSMGLELLALPEIGAFFDPDAAARYRKIQLVTVLQRLPYMALVDAFQHWVYIHPGHSHAEREAIWDQLWHEFMPGVDWGTFHRTRWMRQLHLFKHPLYYIDYALAECGALQLWELARQDRQAGLDAYMRLCALGGTRSLVPFFESAGLKSPFTPGLLGPLMASVAEGLELT